MKITRHTKIHELPRLSKSAQQALNAAGFEVLEDLHEIGFERVAALTQPKDRRLVYEATIRAGITVTFRPDEPISNIPTVSPAAVKKLDKAGFHVLANLEGCDYKAIYDLVGFGAGKALLLGLVLARVTVRFDQPNWTDGEWKGFVESAVQLGLLTWEDVAV